MLIVSFPWTKINKTFSIPCFYDNIVSVQDQGNWRSEQKGNRKMVLKKQKRLIPVIALCALAVSVIGCGSSGNGGNEESRGSEESRGNSGNSGEKSIRSYDVEKYVTLGAYEGMKVEVAGDFEVRDEDVVDYINGMLSYYPDYEDTEKQTVADGDLVNIDYEGKKDGVAFDGGTAQGYVLEIGSNSFIDGFEEGLIGVNVGETVDLNLTFPENYHSADLAGADVVFTVTVNKIVSRIETTYDQLTDEYVKSNLNYDSVEALYNDTKSYMETTNEQNRVAAEREAALNQLIENSKVAIPDGLLEMKVDQYIQQFTRQNCQDGKTLSDYLTANYNMTEETFHSTITKEMEANLDDEMVLEALVKAEGDTIERYQDDYAKYVSAVMKNGNFKTEDELYAAYDSDYEDGRSYLEHRFLLTNALTNLLGQCEITYTGSNEKQAE